MLKDSYLSSVRRQNLSDGLPSNASAQAAEADFPTTLPTWNVGTGAEQKRTDHRANLRDRLVDSHPLKGQATSEGVINLQYYLTERLIYGEAIVTGPLHYH